VTSEGGEAAQTSNARRGHTRLGKRKEDERKMRGGGKKKKIINWEEKKARRKNGKTEGSKAVVGSPNLNGGKPEITSSAPRNRGGGEPQKDSSAKNGMGLKKTYQRGGGKGTIQRPGGQYIWRDRKKEGKKKKTDGEERQKRYKKKDGIHGREDR